MFTAQVKGLDRLEKKLAEIRKRLPDAAEQATKAAAQSTQRVALRFARGAVKGAIRVEVVDKESGAVKASRVFNDTARLPWSSYVEFGTGNYVDNEGVEEAIRLKRAKTIPWYIHVDMVPSSFARFGYPLITGVDGQQYWEVDGMKPRPYMHPAAFENRDKNVELVADGIREMLREVCK